VLWAKPSGTARMMTYWQPNGMGGSLVEEKARDKAMNASANENAKSSESVRDGRLKVSYRRLGQPDAGFRYLD
jgi:hypothetical protein